MSNFDNFNGTLQNATSEGAACPVLKQISTLPEERKAEMLKMYDEMVASGMHSKVTASNTQSEIDRDTSKGSASICPMSNRNIGAETTI